MSTIRSRPFGQRYAFVVVGVVFLCLVVAAGLRGAPSVLMQPLEASLGWSRETISLAAAAGIFLYGLVGPFAAAVMQSFGIKRTLVGALCLMALSTGASAFMTAPWQFVLTWGLLSGLGSGCVAIVLGATIVNRWFVTNRGLVMGILTASTATGALVFLPGLAAIGSSGSWRPMVITVAIACAALVPVVLWLLPERPQAAGLAPYGAKADVVQSPPPVGNPFIRAIRGLVHATGFGDFWLLAGSFFICGYTSNGLIGTHLIPHAVEHGFTEVTAASAVGVMGAMNIVGTLSSGWLSDRFDNRKLLAGYYAFRAISLAALPLVIEARGLYLFAIVYGLDWIATVPPTANLTAKIFGRASLGTIYGWIFFSHMAGAAIAAYLGGFFHEVLGDYHLMFISAALLGFVAAGLALRIAPGTSGRQALVVPAA